MSILLRTVLLLTASNVFMTFAWYAQLRNLRDCAWWIAAVHHMFRGYRVA